MWLYDISSQSRNQEGRVARRIYYLAGGGWQMPPSGDHWSFLTELATRLDGTVLTLISYPTAPGTPAHLSLPQLKQLYEALMRESSRNGETVVVAGDSSGGNIALSLVLWVLSTAEEMGEDSAALRQLAPEAIVAISPSTDLRHEDEDIAAAAEHDPIMTQATIMSTAQAWTGDKASFGPGETWDASDPRVSPILADLDVFCRHGIKVHGLTGGYEVLGPEAVVFRNRLRDLGVEGEWLEWEGQMHCFPLAVRYGLRESREALEWLIQLFQNQ